MTTPDIPPSRTNKLLPKPTQVTGVLLGSFDINFAKSQSKFDVFWLPFRFHKQFL